MRTLTLKCGDIAAWSDTTPFVLPEDFDFEILGMTKEHNPVYILLGLWWRNRIRRAEQKKRYLEARLSTAQRDIRHVKVRYAKITVGGIFGNAEKVHAEEYDISTHKARSVAAMVVSKAIGIAAFGILATSSVIFETSTDIRQPAFKQ